MFIVSAKSTKSYAAKESGGKGYNLYRLTKKGIPVPNWRVVGTSFFKKHIEESGIDKKIIEVLESDKSFGEMSFSITELFLKTEFSAELDKLIEGAIDQLGEEEISVRSSAADEDSASHSFAGQLSSYLYLKSRPEIKLAIKKCWASAYSERGLSYRKQNGLDFSNIQVAVVLQEMIEPDTSGVVFTCDPIKEDSSKILINTVYGVGEGFVSGALEGDTYLMSKNDLSLEEETIALKDKAYRRSSEQGQCLEVDVEKNLQEVSALDGSQKKELSEVALKIEDFYGHPQDIEFAIKEGKIHILQTRPVTSQVPNNNGMLYVWDNSNIVESYGGLTLPLTFNFAHYVYHQVYVQFCEILMVPQKHIMKMDFFLKNMLGLFYGRVYYNLLNWYKLTSILPGYKFNRGFMETMMGTNEALADEIAERVKPPTFHQTFGATLRKIATGAKFYWYHLTIQSVVDKFMDHFYSVYNIFKKKDYDGMSADKIYEDYKILEEQMLWKWHAPIINDFLCMVHFGVFKKLTEKWLGHLGDNFHNDLLAGNGNLESAEPTKRLIQLSGEISKNPKLKELILSTHKDDCLEALVQSEHEDMKNQILDYIDRYGFRCMSEMKLEQKDLHQDPGLLFIFLKNLINSGQTDLHEYEKREKEIRTNAEELLEKNIFGLKKIAYQWSLKHARKAVRNRENTRFCRTRVYGIVRSMFYGIGADFVSKGIIDAKGDIFYISLDELKGALEGTNHIQNLRKVIELRKEEYAGYEETEPAPRFFTRGPVYWNNSHFEKVELPTEIPEGVDMIGLGCCPGVVEGTIKVIMGPDDDLELNGEILVTHRTDPGWIPLYPSISGLLVERGGLLSHSAIVAREMGLPTIVSVKGLTKELKTGMRVRMNGESGTIEILD